MTAARTIRTIPEDLRRTQVEASDPAVSAWVTANAGSGKTHVLAQRVIRLLLEGVDPAKILCITFTKAAAANMANRVFDELRRWTALDDALPLIPMMLAASDRLGYRGAVIAAMGGGHLPERAVDNVHRLAKAMPTVISPRTGGGPMLRKTYAGSSSEIALREAGLIWGGRLHPLKGRVLLETCLRAGLGRPAHAAAAYERACVLDPNDKAACVTAAAALLGIGQFESAAAQAQGADQRGHHGGVAAAEVDGGQLESERALHHRAAGTEGVDARDAHGRDVELAAGDEQLRVQEAAVQVVSLTADGR